ncbi:MAG: OmpA family protein [Paracoccaceae bacterium]|nr:OmpA family protein [Paracoccaceae bacterium]
MKLRTSTTLALTAVVGLAACEPQPFDPNDPNRNTRQGALTGAIGGALAGAIIDDDGSAVDGALIGGVLGAGVGAAVGADLDRQARELAASLDNEIDVINTGDELIVRMPNDLVFAFDSAQVRSDLRQDLLILSDSLNKYPETSVQVVGHTDNVGSFEYNRDLSLRRANAVASILQSGGVRSSRLRTFGAGYDQPIASNSTAEGRAANRRVEITIRPNR